MPALRLGTTLVWLGIAGGWSGIQPSLHAHEEHTATLLPFGDVLVAGGFGLGILVPTAERDATVGLSIFQPLFRSVRAVMYNSPEERAMIHAVSGNHNVPGVVVGIGGRDRILKSLCDAKLLLGEVGGR